MDMVGAQVTREAHRAHGTQADGWLAGSGWRAGGGRPAGGQGKGGGRKHRNMNRNNNTDDGIN